MQRSAFTARPVGSDAESVVVHVQLRPRRGATRRCLAALAALAAEHESVSFSVTGLSKDDRVVRITVGVELGPRAGVAKFSAQAQAAYEFVSALFTSLYDHMPVYTAEPGEAERSAAATLLEAVAGRAGVVAEFVADGGYDDEFAYGAAAPEPRRVVVPTPRPPAPGERIPA
jgi:hypothetical protein